jgi:hypothetical protein
LYGGTGFTTVGLANSDGVTSATITSTGSVATAAVGSYDILISNAVGTGLSNYEITYTKKTLTVGQKALEVIAVDQSKEYGSSYTYGGTEFTTDGLANSDAVTSATITSIGSVATAAVGSYDILISNAAGTGLSNYEIAYTKKTLTVGTKALLITAEDKSKDYGAALPGLTVRYDGLVNGDLAPATLAAISTTGLSTSAVGTYPITAIDAADANYNISYAAGTLTVTAIDASVTPTLSGKNCGDEDPVFRGTLNGFLRSDNVTATYSRTIGETIAGSSYIISATLTPPAVLRNYNITYNTAAFSIVDTSAPVFVETPPVDATVECSAVPEAAILTVTDNCDTIEVVYTEARTNGTSINDYTLTRTWTATDVSENSTSKTQVITVRDTTDPVLSEAPGNVTVECNAVPEAAILTTTDNCDGAPVVTYAEVSTQNSDASTAAHYNYTITRTWRSTDVAGNFTESTQVVTVQDDTAPIAKAQDITVTLDEFGDATITADDIDNGSSDICTYTPSLDVTTFDCTNIGIDNIVTLTVTDPSGNTDSTTANVTVLEHFKETLDLRSLSSFEAFTGTGTVTNSGTFTGDVGANVGALTGFSGPDFNGNVHLNNGLTAQAELDLLKVYIHLNNIAVTHPNANNAAHAPTFGSGEKLTPGVYDIGGAGSVAGNLTLDGLGDQNAVFIMKFKGAFTAGAGSNIVLMNGAKAANVFWVAQGALSVGANSAIKGTLLAYPGAITLGVNSSIEGRLLSSVGAITVGVGGTATMPGTMNILINPMVSYTPAAAVDVLGSLENFSLFTSNGAVANASTSGILGDVGADVGAISGFATSVHVGSFYNAESVTAQAKIDLNNAYSKLMLIATTVSYHTPAFGSGETLSPGVYSTPGAGSLAGTITLDGQNNPDAIFIFKFNGAFAAAAQSKVILSNGTRRCNVFWISEGAASIGSFSTIKGIILAHGGAATMGAGGNLEGRLFSTGGAIGFSTGVTYTVVHDVECVTSISARARTKTGYIKTIETPIKLNAIKLMAYPNPVSTNTTVSFTIPYEEANATLVLYDLKGTLIQVLYNDKTNANQKKEVQFNGENLSMGVYFFKLTTSKEAKSFKVIVK